MVCLQSLSVRLLRSAQVAGGILGAAERLLQSGLVPAGPPAGLYPFPAVAEATPEFPRRDRVSVA